MNYRLLWLNSVQQLRGMPNCTNCNALDKIMIKSQSIVIVNSLFNYQMYSSTFRLSEHSLMTTRDIFSGKQILELMDQTSK